MHQASAILKSMAHRLVFFYLVVGFIAKAGWGFVPSAEFCLPSSGLKELSGCIAMTNKQAECREKSTYEEKIDCYCTQEKLSAFHE